MVVLENIAVLIPALNPDHKLVDLLKELNEIGLLNIVVIDDGSENSFQTLFEEVQTYQAKVCHHKINRGKGAALRTGIEYIKKNQPHVIGIVTADADGQHAPADILKVGVEMAEHNDIVFGTRDFSRPGVPLANKLANLLSAVYYRLKTGKLLNDTQTGLRGIPPRHFDFALNVEGDRYDYEMRFLEQMNENNITYRTVDIETIYEEDRVSHFRALNDSYVIYKPFIKNIASSLLSALVDITFFMLLARIGSSIFAATAVARIISGIFNFSLNKIWVFEKKDSRNTANESLKYLALFSVQLVFSGLLTEALSAAFNFQYGLLLSKILVDCFLFLTNFIVQRFWIFPTNRIMDSKKKNRHTFAFFYTAILIAATVWSLLDTFVIADKVAAVDQTLANTTIYADLENEYSSGASSANTLDEGLYNGSSNSAFVEDTAGSSSGSTFVEDTSANSSDSTFIEDSLGSGSDTTINEDTSGNGSDTIIDEDFSGSSPDSALAGESDINNAAPVITDHSYQDSNVQITIEKIHEYNTDIYIADVVVTDIAYLKTALANNTFGRNIKEATSDMAEEHDAILAINGDYYGFRNAGFVIRNGVLYQTTPAGRSSEALVIHADGSFEIIDEASSDAQTLYDEGALQAFSFGPGLVEDGEISVTTSSEVSRSKSSNPRTAIGMIDPLHYIFVVSDGRTSQSTGLSLLELAEVMQAYGATEAYNLDGGGSSTMVFNGQVVNNPTDGRSYGERRVSDIIYIGAYL